MQSVWQKYINQQKSDKPKSDTLDTVVVGGGIAGIMCAYMLCKSGHNVTIIEAAKILDGVTKNTTAHVTALQATYQDIPTNKKRRFYYDSQTKAIDGIEGLVKKHNIDCDFERVDACVFSDAYNRKNLQKEYKIMQKIGVFVQYNAGEKLPFGTYDTICLSDQAQFNPIKFCNGLLDAVADKLTIIENARIKKVCLMRKILKTEQESFKYKRVIFATGYPIVNIRGLYAFKLYKSFSYAACTQSDIKLGTIYNSMATDGYTYRSCTDGVIVGGLDHRTGRWKCETYFDMLAEQSKRFGNELTNTWAANDCMTFDSVPMAGRMFPLCARNTFLVSGFGKWGMTNSYACAQIVDDIINKRANPYARIFCPMRFLNIKVWGKFFINFCVDVGGLIQGLFSRKSRRCPHMGCRLKLNPNTKTYDCPCHGTRLTQKGDIITSPAVDANEKLSK